jgi:osmotically-inducible protein OsmY
MNRTVSREILSLRHYALVCVLALAGFTSARPGQQALRPTDERLEQLVEAALAADPVVESVEVVVTVIDGTAKLNGAVDTDEERARAGSVAADIEGVAEVDNEITVARAQLSPERSDEEIRTVFLEEAADAFPEGGIEVRIEDGFATLTGTVSSTEMRRRMTEIAFRAGALLVKNQIDVDEP